MTDHLGYAKGERSGWHGANNRNGHSAKTVLTDTGSLTLSIPRDREGTFESAIVPKGVTRLDGINGQIISLYARGLSARDVAAHLRERLWWRDAHVAGDTEAAAQIIPERHAILHASLGKAKEGVAAIAPAVAACSGTDLAAGDMAADVVLQAH